MAKNRTDKGRPLVDLHMSVMNRDFAADADRVAVVCSATRLDSVRYRRVTARCMPAPIASAAAPRPAVAITSAHAPQLLHITAATAARDHVGIPTNAQRPSAYTA